MGNQLWIGDKRFEDLDEILHAYIEPIVQHARELQSFRVFHKESDADIQEMLATEKMKAPQRIPYFIGLDRAHPGYFMLWYQPSRSPRKEYISLTPDGFKFRQQVFATPEKLIRWFKQHYADPIPASERPGKQSSSQPAADAAAATLSNIPWGGKAPATETNQWAIGIGAEPVPSWGALSSNAPTPAAPAPTGGRLRGACHKCGEIGHNAVDCKAQGGGPDATLFVGGLPRQAIDDRELRALLGSVSKLVFLTVAKDRNTGEPRGIAFAEYASREDAQRALDALNGRDFAGRALRLEFSM